MRRCLAGVVAVLMAACAASAPTQPTPVAGQTRRLLLSPGPHWVTLTGFNLSDLAEFPPCTPFTIPPTPPSGTMVTTPVSLAREGEDWVARSDPASADSIELRFRETQLGPGGLGIMGTARGTASDVDRPPAHSATGSIVSIAGDAAGTPADVTGVGVPYSVNAPASASFAGGRVAGRVTFSDAAGRAATCTAVQWSLFSNQ